VGVSDGLARQARLALVSGKDAKQVVFAAYDEQEGAIVGRRMEFLDLLTSKDGEVTTVEILRYQRKSLDPATFDPPRAKDGSRE